MRADDREEGGNVGTSHVPPVDSHGYAGMGLTGVHQPVLWQHPFATSYGRKGNISLWFGTKVNILATKVRSFFSTFILIPISYVSSIVPPLPTVSRKQNMAGKGQYFLGAVHGTQNGFATWDG